MSTPALPRHDTATYLHALRPRLKRANDSRRGWLSQVGLLVADRRHGTSSEVIAAVAARSGETQGRAFRAVRADVAGLEPAPDCETCHLAVMGWLDKQIAACDLMVEIGQTRQVERLREVIGLIAEARHDGRLFSYEIAERVAALRHRRQAATAAQGRARGARPRGRLPDGRAAGPAAVGDAGGAGSLWGRVARLFGGESSDPLGSAD
jgi:hypothetical protein